MTISETIKNLEAIKERFGDLEVFVPIERNRGKTLKLQDVKVPIRKPKYECKNRHLQKLLIKIFGYEMTYETRQAEVIINKAEDYPFSGFNGDFTFTIEEGD